MNEQSIATNLAPAIRVFSGQFLHRSGQQITLIGFCPLRKMLRHRNVTPMKKMAEKALFVAIVFSFVAADSQGIFPNRE
jgi:hypothetical protein